MTKEELTNDLKDLIIRVEGTINVLHRPDVIRADRKLQGIRDKLVALLIKATKEKPVTSAEELVKQVQSINI
jgi:hypothetical protein